MDLGQPGGVSEAIARVERLVESNIIAWQWKTWAATGTGAAGPRLAVAQQQVVDVLRRAAA